MIFQFSKEQAQYIKPQLPLNYCLQRVNKYENKGELDVKNKITFEIQSSVLEDQRKCIEILTELKKTEQFKQLINKELPTYSKYFSIKFSSMEDFYKNTKNEALQKTTLVYGTFWKDMSELFIRAKFMNKEALKLLEDLENRLHYLFTPYQTQCLRDTNTLLFTKLRNGRDKKIEKLKIRAPPNDKDKQELLEKLKKLPIQNMSYILEYLQVKEQSSFELNLDKLDAIQFKKLHDFTKKRIDQKKLNKMFQKFRKEHMANTEYDEYSYQSCLSESEQL